MSHTLVIGGASSGKSLFAEQQALQHSQHPLYIATMQRYFYQTPDVELEKRLEKHQARRGNHWKLVEEPFDIAKAILSYASHYNVILIDCLTLWLTNLIFDKRNIDNCFCALEDSLKHVGNSCHIICVTNELGHAIIPMEKETRLFVQYQGQLNQRIAQACHTVYFVTAGLPMKMK